MTISLGDALTLPITLNEKTTVYGLVTDVSGLLAAPANLANVTITITDTTSGGIVTTTPTPLTSANTPTTGPDGSPANYQATFIVTPGHTYTVSGAKPNFDAVKAATITRLREDRHELIFNLPAVLVCWEAWSAMPAPVRLSAVRRSPSRTLPETRLPRLRQALRPRLRLTISAQTIRVK